MPGVILLDATTGNPTEIPAEKAREALASGKYVESTQVPTAQDARKDVSLQPGGTALDRLDLGRGVTQSTADVAADMAKESLDDRLGGFEGGVESFGEGILGGLTLGVYEGEQGLEGDARREVNSGLYTAGELAAFVASMGVPLSPVGKLTQLSAQAGKAITKAAGGGRLASIAGTAAEGAIFGAAAEGVHGISDVVIRDKEFVAERLVSAMEMGALFGGASEAVLQGAKRVLAKEGAALKTSATKEAVLPQADLDKMHAGIGDARKVMDDALDEYSKRQTILASFQEDVIAGRSIAATPDAPWFRAADDWFKTNEDLLGKAYALRKQLDSFDGKKVLQGTKGAAEKYARTISAYEDTLASLQKQLGSPPKELLQAGAMADNIATKADDGVTAVGGGKPGDDIVDKTWVDRDVPRGRPDGDIADKTWVDRVKRGDAVADDTWVGKGHPGDDIADKTWVDRAARGSDTAVNKRAVVPDTEVMGRGGAVDDAATNPGLRGVREADAAAVSSGAGSATPPGLRAFRQPLGADETAALRGRAKANIAGDATANLKGGGRAISAPVTTAPRRNPTLQKYLDDWSVAGATDELIFPSTDVSRPRLANPVGNLRQQVQETIAALNIPQGAIDLRAIYRIKGGKAGEEISDLGNAVLDGWAARAFGDDAAREAAGEATKLRKRGMAPKEEAKSGIVQRLLAPLARYAARRQLGYGYVGMAAGQLAYGAVSTIGGSLAVIVGLAHEAHVKAAQAVNALLQGRTGTMTKVGVKLHVSYTGDPEDASSNVAERVHQLNLLRQNPGAVAERVNQSLQFMVKHDPELAAHAKDAAVNKYENLLRRAPAFIATPDKVPERPMGAEWDAFEQYEKVTHDSSVAVAAVASGTLTMAMGEALREQHPALHRRMVEAAMEGLSPKIIRAMTPKQTEQLGYLLGSPIIPDRFLDVQGMHDQKRQQSEEVPGGSTNWRGQPKTLSQQQQTPLIRPGQQPLQ